jgi:hypothetical protein
MAKTDKKKEKKSKAKVDKKTSATKVKDIVTSAVCRPSVTIPFMNVVQHSKSKTSAKAVTKGNFESDSSDSEPEKVSHSVSNGKVRRAHLFFCCYPVIHDHLTTVKEY